jgi:Putative transmembrane protein (PGPGW)
MAMIDHALAEPAAFWLLAFSVAVLVVSIIAVPWIVARMPADYFVRERDVPWQDAHPVVRIVLHAGKNTLGLLLVLAGVAMLVLPGQGILTMLVGLSLVEFPGKRKMQIRILRLPGVKKVVAVLRRRAGRPPLILEF